MGRRGLLLLGVVGVVVGVGAARAAFGAGDPVAGLFDLAVGWVFLTGGLVAWWRRPESRTGALMAATGLTWFVGNFSSVGWAPVAWLAAHAIHLYWGPLVHTVLSYPDGRLGSRLDRVLVAVGYVAAVATPLAWRDVIIVALAILLVAAAFRGYHTTRGGARRTRVPVVRAVALVGSVVVGGVVVRLLFPAGDANEAALLAYEAALCVLGLALLAGLLRTPVGGQAVTDLVVELGEARSVTLRDQLARALGDPTLEVGYLLPEAGGYVDAEGRGLVFPEPEAGRSVTLVERDGRPVVALVHDPAVLDDPALVEAVGSAARLAAANARLQAEVRARLVELQASRRRLLQADDEERQRLERRLRERAERRLVALSGTLERIRVRAGPAAAEPLGRAQEQLAGTIDELHELASGLHPRVLAEQGLEGALEALAARSPIPVDVASTGPRLPQPVAVAIYFVCSEALANVAKYGSASRVRIAVGRRGGVATVEVSDDGVGGADPVRGTGLRGLADRVETLGGTLRIQSEPGRGTLLAAEIPLGGKEPFAYG